MKALGGSGLRARCDAAVTCDLGSATRIGKHLVALAALLLLGLGLLSLARGAADGVGGTDGTPDSSHTTSATGPTVTILSTSNLRANQVTLSLRSSATGTGYFTLLVASDTVCGTGTQVKAGQTSTNAAAFRRGSLKR